MASKYWIKLYHEILDDPKMGTMSDHLWRRTIEIFLLAGEHDQDGLLPPPEQIAWKLRISLDDCNETLQELKRCNILIQNDDGNYVVRKFQERQAKVPVAERVRQYRKRQAKSPTLEPEKPTKPSENGSLPPENDSGGEKSNKTVTDFSNDDVTERYLDTDTELTTTHKNAPAPVREDYLSHIVTHQPGREGIADPDQDLIAHFGYRDQALKIHHDLTGLWADTQVSKPAIITLAQEADFSIERWETSIKTCRLAGVRPENTQCFIDTYHAGGDYQVLLKQKYGAKNAAHQRNSRKSKPKYYEQDPATRKPYDRDADIAGALEWMARVRRKPSPPN